MSTLTGGPGNIVTNGLAAYYDVANYLSYTSGSNILYGVNSTSLSGSIVSASYSSNNVGYLEFNGTGSAVDCNVNFLTTPTSITIELWTRPGPNQANAGMNPIGYAQQSATNQGTGFMVHNGDSSLYSFMVSGSTRSTQLNITPLPSGSWYQIVFSYNLETQIVKGYKNGI